MHIALITPARAGSRTGNRHTALRWAAFLRAAGHRVTIADAWTPAIGGDLLLALHARRSGESIQAFAGTRAGRPIVLALTGTDVYRDIHDDAVAKRSLAMADRLIVLQPRAALELAANLRRRVHVVIQSCNTALTQTPVQRRFRFCVIGHMRPEKDPLLAAQALRKLPDRLGVELVQVGSALEERYAHLAARMAAADGRYRWVGDVPHSRALRWLASSHAMVISSRMEGGANVVCEALRIGVPVLASRISGNLGLLGPGYSAYFAPGDAADLGRLMSLVVRRKACYERLKQSVLGLRPMVSPEREASSLCDALRF